MYNNNNWFNDNKALTVAPRLRFGYRCINWALAPNF